MTALVFTAVLVCAMLAQSYYFNHTYLVYTFNDPRRYTDMLSELNKSDMGEKAIGKVMQKYKDRYEMASAVLEPDRTTVVLTSSSDPEFEDGLSFYLSDLSNSLIDSDNIYQGQFFPAASPGRAYSLMAAKYLNGGLILFAMFPEQTLRTPGLVDQYYVPVLLIGVVISFLLSLIFSLFVSKPLIYINEIAKKMADLDFHRMIKIKSNDELGQLSRSLNQLSKKLDATLKELTSANAKLESDIFKEREIEKDRREFVANVSHELKTPLAIIKGYSEALKDNVREDKKGHYLEQTIQQADTMGKLVEDMLELSRMESGHYKPQLIDFDITMLTKDILESLRLLADEKNLYVSLVSSAPAITVQADRMKIGQVIGNFINNAIRYTPVNGRVFIRITEADASVRFEVENEGANIAPDKIDKVWARFYREEKARDKKTGGTGLGLALSEKILQAHHMEYGAENTQTGVLFYFTAEQGK